MKVPLTLLFVSILDCSNAKTQLLKAHHGCDQQRTIYLEDGSCFLTNYGVVRPNCESQDNYVSRHTVNLDFTDDESLEVCSSDTFITDSVKKGECLTRKIGTEKPLIQPVDCFEPVTYARIAYHGSNDGTCSQKRTTAFGYVPEGECSLVEWGNSGVGTPYVESFKVTCNNDDGTAQVERFFNSSTCEGTGTKRSGIQTVEKTIIERHGCTSFSVDGQEMDFQVQCMRNDITFAPTSSPIKSLAPTTTAPTNSKTFAPTDSPTIPQTDAPTKKSDALSSASHFFISCFVISALVFF